jgi:hypothetical protein
MQVRNFDEIKEELTLIVKNNQTMDDIRVKVGRYLEDKLRRKVIETYIIMEDIDTSKHLEFDVFFQYMDRDGALRWRKYEFVKTNEIAFADYVGDDEE